MNKKILKELKSVKKLLVLHLLKSGATQREIKNILKTSGTEFKKIIPRKKIKRYK